MRHFSPNVIHVCSDLPFRRLLAPNRPFELMESSWNEYGSSEGSVEDSQPEEEPSSAEREPPRPLPASANPSNVTPAPVDDDSDVPESLVASFQPAPRRTVSVNPNNTTQVLPAGHSR